MLENCPRCGVDFQGEPIPEADQEWFGNKTHFSRIIGHEFLGHDHIDEWACPDCGYTWSRAGVHGDAPS